MASKYSHFKKMEIAQTLFSPPFTILGSARTVKISPPKRQLREITASGATANSLRKPIEKLWNVIYNQPIKTAKASETYVWVHVAYKV